MKFQPDRPDTSLNHISRHSPEGVTVNGRLHRSSLVVPWSGELIDWTCQRMEELTVEHFSQLADYAPEVVLLGTGSRLRFAKPEVLRPLIERGIGVETMDTAAACRTYGILSAENRRVVAALLIETQTTT